MSLFGEAMVWEKALEDGDTDRGLFVPRGHGRFISDAKLVNR